MPARPEPVGRNEAERESVRELIEEAEQGWYGDAAYFGAMAHVPVLFERIVETFKAFPTGENVTTTMLELMRLKVAERHQCAYCATVRTLDVREEVAPKEDAVFGDIDESGLTRAEYLAVSLADQLSENPHRLDDEFFADLQDVFSDAEIMELLLFGSLEVGLDRFCIALELQPTDESSYPDDVEYPLENPRPKTK